MKRPYKKKEEEEEKEEKDEKKRKPDFNVEPTATSTHS